MPGWRWRGGHQAQRVPDVTGAPTPHHNPARRPRDEFWSCKQYKRRRSQASAADFCRDNKGFPKLIEDFLGMHLIEVKGSRAAGPMHYLVRYEVPSGETDACDSTVDAGNITADAKARGPQPRRRRNPCQDKRWRRLPNRLACRRRRASEHPMSRSSRP